MDICKTKTISDLTFTDKFGDKQSQDVMDALEDPRNLTYADGIIISQKMNQHPWDNI